MTSKVEVSLRKLSSVSENFNKLSDELNDQLADLETAITSLHLGVQAWVQLSEYQTVDGQAEPTGTCVIRIGYGRHGSKWALLYADYSKEDGFRPDDIGLLRDAPRKIRIDAMSKIPDLLEKLAESASKLTEEAAKGVEETKQISSALRRSVVRQFPDLML